MWSKLSKSRNVFSTLDEYFEVENTDWKGSEEICWKEEERKDPVTKTLKTGGKCAAFLFSVTLKIYHFIHPFIQKAIRIVQQNIKLSMAQLPKIKTLGEEIIRSTKKSPILQKVQNRREVENELPTEKVKQHQNRFQQAFKSYLNQNERVEEKPKARKYFGGIYS